MTRGEQGSVRPCRVRTGTQRVARSRAHRARQARHGAIEQSREDTAATLETLDARLGAHDYIAGTDFCTGDIAMGCGVWRWLSLPIVRPNLPHVQGWVERLALRPPYRKVVMLPLTWRACGYRLNELGRSPTVPEHCADIARAVMGLDFWHPSMD